MNLHDTSLAQQCMANPQVDLWVVLAPERTEPYLARIQTRAAVTEEQQPSDAAPVQHPPLAGDAQDGHGLPQVAPAPRERAGTHGLRQRKEGQHVLLSLVWEGVKPINTASRLRHYVEQVAIAVAGTWKWCKEHGENIRDLELVQMIPRLIT
uniref:Uncharacterized protein n=1 Tax=Leersia perrieri TaxID=77586 RepID=A0A0D9XQ41_9ORYZ